MSEKNQESELIDQYINNINSGEYKNYINKLRDYFSYKEIIIDNETKKSYATSYYVETSEIYEIYIDKVIHMIIQKPKYENLWDTIRKLKNEREKLLIDYNISVKKLIFEEQKKYQEYVNLEITKIINIDIKIRSLYEYYLTINRFEEKYAEYIEKYNTIKNYKKDIYDNKITKINDKSERLSILVGYIKGSIDSQDELENCISKIKKKNNKDDEINYLVIKLPTVTILEITKEKHKEIKKIKTIEKIKDIETKIKDVLVNQFKFKTAEECSSSKRSAAYYMSKDELLEVIKNNKNIKAIMPAKYTTMKKAQICEILDKNNYIS